MAGGQPESPAPGPFVCEFCDEAWPSAPALSAHIIKAHTKGKAPAQEQEQEPLPSVPAPAPAPFGRGPGMTMAPVMPPSLFVPPPGFSFDGGRQPPRHVQARQPQAPPLGDPVVYDDAGEEIRMVLLEPNRAFWATYRMGMDAPEEIDFMGLRRPHSPSPSFSSWLDLQADME